MYKERASGVYLMASYAWVRGYTVCVRESDMWPGYLELFLYEGSRLPVSRDFHYALRFLDVEEEAPSKT